MNRIAQLIAAAVTLLVVVVPVAFSPLPAGADPAPSNCMASPGTPQKNLPVIEVLTGITTDDHSPTMVSTRAAAVLKVVSAGFGMGARLLIDAIGAGPSESDLAVNTQLQATGPNQLFQQQNQQCKQRDAMAAFTSLQRRTIPGQPDVLGALQVAQSNLTGLVAKKTPIDVVLMSSMLDVGGPLAFETPTGLAQNPTALIAEVRSDDLMPNCGGWNVYVVGAGTESTSSLSDLQYEQLKTFWNDFFAACGGRVVLYDNQLTQFPIQPVARVAAHLVAKTRTNPITLQQEVVITLPGDVLFASGSATLSSDSDAVLEQLLPVLLHQYPHGSIQVTGYTDNVPIDIPGGNVQLSVERAQAVLAWLTQNGVLEDRLNALGLGAADPIASNSTAAGQAANRRVVVAVTK